MSPMSALNPSETKVFNLKFKVIEKVSREEIADYIKRGWSERH